MANNGKKPQQFTMNIMNIAIISPSCLTGIDNQKDIDLGGFSVFTGLNPGEQAAAPKAAKSAVIAPGLEDVVIQHLLNWS